MREQDDLPALLPFSFDGVEVRVVQQAGDPWFVAPDLCKALHLSNPSVAVKALDEDERAKFNLGRQGETTIVSESGAYALILRCRGATKPGTIPHRARRWITSDVIPSIRKTGSYGQPATLALNDPAALRAALLTYVDQVIALEGRVAVLEPKAEAFENLAEPSTGCVLPSDMARSLDVSQDRLFADLIAMGWAFRRRSGARLTGRASAVKRKLLEHRRSSWTDKHGEHFHLQVWITGLGQQQLTLHYTTRRGELFERGAQKSLPAPTLQLTGHA